ncbi:MAG TPA: glycerophosphodiester phosphodiesterase [Aggregatilineales bacterium]|nr:glycerophosphodiester phosphodiesterase [Aggregatilineales bacterium]
MTGSEADDRADAPFKVMAHRGASAQAPGNTVEAFRLAIAQAAPMIETDVRLSADGVLVIEHDEDFGGVLVAETTLGELRRLNPALLTVAAALAEFGAQVPFCWELKAPRIEAALVNLVRDLVPKAIWEQSEFTSFVFRTAVAVRHLAPRTTVGWLTADWNEAVIARTRDADLNQICPPAAKILAEPALVKSARDAGLQVRAWLIDSPDRVPALASAGVCGGTVNFPAEALARLAATKGDSGRR